MKEFFRKFSITATVALGSYQAFLLACAVVIVWAFSGFFFTDYNLWLLIINTVTTIVTFLMTFIILMATIRQGKELIILIKELIRVTDARNELLKVEEKSEDEVAKLEIEFRKEAE